MNVKLKPISEQVLVITGASSGIGLATAQMAAEKGARVVLAARDAAALREAAEKIEAGGGEAHYVVTDVSDPDAVRRLSEEAVERFGYYDTWVNNAGVSIYGRIEKVPLDEARQLFDVNYWGVVHGSQAAFEYLKDRGGAIINLGSAVAERAIPLQAHYSASKHAIKGFTEGLRVELEKDGHPIAVTLVKPGSINTPYPDHAKNYMDEEPTLPPPVYSPDVVARAILTCAETPKREITIGAGGRLIEAMDEMPGVADRYMEASVFDGQQAERFGTPGDSLYGPSGPGAEKTGPYSGHTMQTSLYTQAALRPGLALGVAAAVGAGLATLVARAR